MLMELTLSKDKVIGLNEVVKSSLCELGDVGFAISFGEGGESGQQAHGNALVQHGDCCGFVFFEMW